MAKLILPLHSTNARGRISKAVIFSSNRGRPYTKAYAKPTDPRTSSQRGHRALITFLTKEWSQLTPGARASWLAPSRRSNLSPYHLYIRYNQNRWVRGQYPIDTWADFTQTTPGVFGNPNWDEQENQVVSRSNILPKNDCWGHIWYLGFTEYPPHTIHWVATVSGFDADGFAWHIQTDMTPGEYWYSCAHFTRSGTFTDEEYGGRIIL